MKKKRRSRFWLTAVMLGIAITLIAAIQPAYAVQYTTSTTYNDQFPRINGSGQVVWNGSDGTDLEIFIATPTGATPTMVILNTQFLYFNQILLSTKRVNLLFGIFGYLIFKYLKSILWTKYNMIFAFINTM